MKYGFERVPSGTVVRSKDGTVTVGFKEPNQRVQSPRSFFVEIDDVAYCIVGGREFVYSPTGGENEFTYTEEIGSHLFSGGGKIREENGRSRILQFSTEFLDPSHNFDVVLQILSEALPAYYGKSTSYSGRYFAGISRTKRFGTVH